VVIEAKDGLRAWDLRRLRAGLADLGLDWDAPPYPALKEKKDRPPLQVTVDLGELAPETPQQAVVKYSLAIAFMPLSPEAYLRRGRAYFQLKKWREAADDLQAALTLNPGVSEPQIWFELGYASAESGRPKQAMAAYSRTVQLNPKLDAAWNNRGSLHEQFGDLEKAVADFSKAIELNGQDWLPRNNRSRVYASLGQ